MAEAVIRFAGETNIGLTRHRNEDCFVYTAEPGKYAMAAVADGIGGHKDGDIASFFCCGELLAAWKRNAANVTDTPSALDFLQKKLTAINESIYATNRIRRNVHSMGTTVVAAIFTPGEIVCCYAGDSRLYSYHDGMGLTQETIDDSLLNHANINSRQTHMATVPGAENVITKALGPKKDLELGICTIPRSSGNRYLLCTDGLSRFVSHETMEIALGSSDTPANAVDRLMRAALIAGGRDNITIICAFED